MKCLLATSTAGAPATRGQSPTGPCLIERVIETSLLQTKAGKLDAGLRHCIMSAVLRGATLRPIALLVLFSGAAYFAFDRSDPLAPMSAAETPGFIPTSVSYHLSPTTIRTHRH
jgi:hypothetical protein